MAVDCVVQKLIQLKLPLTVDNWITFAYFGEKKFSDLEGEELVEVLRLVDENVLVPQESGYKN